MVAVPAKSRYGETMKPSAVKDILGRLDRIEGLLALHLLKDRRVAPKDLKPLKLSARAFVAAKKAVLDFDIGSYVKGVDVKKWK